MVHDAASSESQLARGWALFVYGFCSCIGLVDIAVQFWKHGITRPEMFAVPVAISTLSLVWLRTALRAGPPSKAKFGTHSTVIVILIGAESIVSLFRL